MPVSTETYWNIKRLNVVFAFSAAALLAVTLVSVIQDYNRQWRQEQRSGRVWDAALADDRTAAPDALNKKRATLVPEPFAASVSAVARDLPLLEFVNPAQRVQQIVLPDIRQDMAFLKVATIDRCTTCHINIADKDYSRAGVIAYLEEQLSAARGYQLLSAMDPNNPATPTAAHPGAAAKPEFWHYWARALLPPSTYTRIAAPLAREILGAMGKADGATTRPANTHPSAADQDKILLATIDALYMSAGNRAVAIQRNYALRYPQMLADLLRARLTQEQYKQLEERYRQALIADVNAARHGRGLPDLDPSPALLAHPDLSLYVDADSKHPAELVGCTVCHDGSGQETNFVQAAHTPRAIWVDRDTGQVVLPEQLRPLMPPQPPAPDLSNMLAAIFPGSSPIPTRVASLLIKLSPGDGSQSTEKEPDLLAQAPKFNEDFQPVPYVDPVTQERRLAVSQAQYWRGKYQGESGTTFAHVNEMWDRPMRPAQYVQANCVRCHSDVYDIKDSAPAVYQGRRLFTTMGCADCHQNDRVPDDEKRKVGPDLRHVTAKLSAQFINTWLWAPKAFRPSTKMPHFFMLENNSSDEELLRTQQETRAITEYLVQTATPLPPQYPFPPNITGDYERGRRLFLGANGAAPRPQAHDIRTNALDAGVGCLACHALLNEQAHNWIVNDLVLDQGMAAADAEAQFAAMDFNQWQLYCIRQFTPPIGTTTPKLYYSDDAHTPRPIFVRHGPELSGIGTKLLTRRSPQQAMNWLFDWLKEPLHYAQGTTMPSLRLSDQEAVDLATYLLGQTRDKTDTDLKTGRTDAWQADLAPTDARKLNEITIHFLAGANSAADAARRAIDPAAMTAAAADALTSAAMPADDARKLAAMLSLQQCQQVFVGKRLIAYYGCMSCHLINGAEGMTNIGSDLSDWGEKQVSKLDFGYLDPAKADQLPATSAVHALNGLCPDAANLLHTDLDTSEVGSPTTQVAWPALAETRESWITQKLQSTRIWDRGRVLLEPVRAIGADGTVSDAGGPGSPYDKLKMPTFFLNDQQISQLVTFVLSDREPLVSDRMAALTVTPQSHAIARGRAVVELYNCTGCHQIEGNVAQLQQYFNSGELTTYAPPNLRGEGNKIQPQWLYNYFKNVEPIRPLPQVRMPSFPWNQSAGPDQVQPVIDYFAASSQKEAGELKSLLAPIEKYIDSQTKFAAAATRPAMQPPVPDSFPPGDDWWNQPLLSGQRDKLLQWAVDKNQIPPADADFARPANITPAALDELYNTVLFKARFIARLYDAPYPLVDAPYAAAPTQRFLLGEQFFRGLPCLTCHTVGDPHAPGVLATPKGPNLDNVYRRVQERWVRQWVQEAPIIQYNTNMPQLFGGLFPASHIFLQNGQVFAAAQGRTPAEIATEMATYGQTSDDQIQLLMDFIFESGATGHTTVARPTTAPTTIPPPP